MTDFKSPKPPSTPKKTPQKSPKKITFQWDDYRRQVLCCLYRFYNCEHGDLQKIFSDIFKNHLLERGFPKGQISYRVLNAQWSWMKRNDNPAWMYVHKETAFRKDREWKDAIQQINHSAGKLQILLVEKEYDTENVEVDDSESFTMEQVMQITADTPSPVRDSVLESSLTYLTNLISTRQKLNLNAKATIISLNLL